MLFRSDKEQEFVVVSAPEEAAHKAEPIEPIESTEEIDKVTEHPQTEVVAEKEASNELLIQKTERKFSRSPRGNTKNPIEAFGVHPDSNRAKALTKMEKRLNQMISLEDLVIAVYGTNEKKNFALFNMVMKGLLSIQDNNSLDVEIRKDKVAHKGISYGLYTK